MFLDFVAAASAGKPDEMVYRDSKVVVEVGAIAEGKISFGSHNGLERCVVETFLFSINVRIKFVFLNTKVFVSVVKK